MRVFFPLALACVLATTSNHAFGAGTRSAITASDQLATILTCRSTASVSRVVDLIYHLGGGVITASSLSAEFTLPNSVDVFGRPVQRITIHQRENGDGAYTEYVSVFDHETIDTVARLADVPMDRNLGYFYKPVDGHDLTVRADAGAGVVTCAQDVRTFKKTVRRVINETFAQRS